MRERRNERGIEKKRKKKRTKKERFEGKEKCKKSEVLWTKEKRRKVT